MKKLRLLVVSTAVLVVSAVGASTTAASFGGLTCAGGTIPSGTYHGNLTVNGKCTFADGAAVTIDGNVIVAPLSVLNDHAGSTATVHITGSVLVGHGGVVGLGSYIPGPHTSAVVDGNVVALGAASLYLGGMTVHGSVTVLGGGSGARNLPIKDDTIDGNVTISGWRGLWFGVIRDDVGGSVTLLNNTAADTSQLPGSDSSEVVTNTIAGNLACYGNTPAPQVGDSEGATNTVGGLKLGQCSGL